MSRPRTPVAVKRLNGNPGRRSQDLTAGIILPPAMPPPPPGLPADVTAAFNETAALLFAIGTLAACDVGGLERYATYSVLLRRAHRDLARLPYYRITAGRITYNPALKIVREIVPLQTKFETEMGLTAAARSKIDIGPKEKPDDSFTRKFLTPLP